MKNYTDVLKDRASEEISRYFGTPSLYYWAVHSDSSVSILSYDELVEEIRQSIDASSDYRELLLELKGAKSFKEAKKEAICKLQFAISELKLSVSILKTRTR